MKFDGAPFAANGVEPTWFIEFLFNYNRVIKFLVEYNLRKMKLGPDVAEFTVSRIINDSQDVEIVHGLGVQTSRVIVNGRTETCIIRASTSNSTTINCRMISFRLAPGQKGYQSQIWLEDTRQLFPNDILRIDNQTRRVSSVNGTSVTLDSVINCDMVTAISLAQDTVSVTVI